LLTTTQTVSLRLKQIKYQTPRVPMERNTATTSQWIWLLLAISLTTLIFQVFPSAWWVVVSIVDVRSWTWRSYATAFAVALVVLMAARAWQESLRQSR
jgi:hypothetical protein